MLICDLRELILFSYNNTVGRRIGHFCSYFECFDLVSWNCVRNSHWLRLRFDRQASTLVATEKSANRSRAWCEGHPWCVGRGESENSIYFHTGLVDIQEISLVYLSIQISLMNVSKACFGFKWWLEMHLWRWGALDSPLNFHHFQSFRIRTLRYDTSCDFSRY